MIRQEIVKLKKSFRLVDDLKSVRYSCLMDIVADSDLKTKIISLIRCTIKSSRDRSKGVFWNAFIYYVWDVWDHLKELTSLLPKMWIILASFLWVNHRCRFSTEAWIFLLLLALYLVVISLLVSNVPLNIYPTRTSA